MLTTDEVDAIEVVYDRFMRGEIDVPGKDLYDMVTGEYGTDPTDYAIFNVMLPRRYHPDWQDNIFERVGLSIAEQLCGEDMMLDFDQLLAKQPGREDAVFAWHQDQAYWINTDDRRTATCWLAIDDSTIENGCMQFLPESHRESVRPHRPLSGNREDQHTLVTDISGPMTRSSPWRSVAATSRCTTRASCTGWGQHLGQQSPPRLHHGVPVDCDRPSGMSARLHPLAQRCTRDLDDR